MKSYIRYLNFLKCWYYLMIYWTPTYGWNRLNILQYGNRPKTIKRLSWISWQEWSADITKHIMRKCLPDSYCSIRRAAKYFTEIMCTIIIYKSPSLYTLNILFTLRYSLQEIPKSLICLYSQIYSPRYRSNP